MSRDWPIFKDDDGTLVPIEFSKLPFEPRRIFYVCDVPRGEERGMHAHHETQQILTCVQGKILVKLHNGNKLSEVVLEENAYFKSIKAAAIKLKKKNQYHNKSEYILYLCSPVADQANLFFGDEKYWGYDEHDRIRYFMLNLHKLNVSAKKIVFRLHPSERVDKYNWVRSEFGPLVSIGGKKTLLEEVLESELVVGCNSMGLAIAIIVVGLDGSHHIWSKWSDSERTSG